MCESFINNAGVYHRPTKGRQTRCNMPVMPGKLFCNRCLDYKPDDCFKFHASRSDGRAQKCNDCQKEINDQKKPVNQSTIYAFNALSTYRALSPIAFF